MDSSPLDGPAFAEALGTGDAPLRLAGPGGRLVTVDAHGLPDRLDDEAMERLATVPAVVAALTDDPDRRPDWADLSCPPGRPLGTVAASVAANPVAATVLALLLRSGGRRSVADGLVAESLAYGLLQGGPEFARWRADRPARRREPVPGPTVLVDRSDGALTVTLHRPHVRNALDSAMRDELEAALAVAAFDPSVTEVHLRGSGPSFCAGGDLDEFGTRTDPASAHLLRLLASPARSLAGLSARTTAHLHGDAVGSGIELAAFAARVVADRDTRIALPEVALGLIPGAGARSACPGVSAGTAHCPWPCRGFRSTPGRRGTGGWSTR